MENLRFIQVYLVAISMLAVILIKIYSDKENDSFVNRLYVAIVWITIAILFIEAVGWLFDGVPGLSAFYVVMISDAILLVLILVPGILWMIYADYHIYSDLTRSRTLAALSAVILFYIMILSFSAPFNHLLFYIDQSNYYHRGPWHWQSQICYYSFFIYVFIIINLNWKRVSRQILLPLLFFAIPPLIGTILQMAFLRFVAGLEWG